MKAYVIENSRYGEVKDIPIPDLKENEVLIKVMAAGLCGTDGHIYLGEYFSEFPLVPGHEFSGVIEEVGIKVKGFRVGQRVTADPNIFCEKCDYCKQNVQNFCKDFAAVGVTRNGAFAEYVAVPEACVFDIGDLDFTEASLIEPLSCVVYGQEKARPKVGDNVLIFGAGPIGLLHLQLAKHNGATSITVVDLKEKRLELAKKLGADYTIVSDSLIDEKLRKHFPDGFNLVIDSTGVPKVVEKAISFVRNSGTLLVFGVCPNNSKVEFNPYEIFRKELTIIGSFALKKTFQKAISLMQAQKIDVSDLIGQKITLEQMTEQMDQFINGKCPMKTVVFPNGIDV